MLPLVSDMCHSVELVLPLIVPSIPNLVDVIHTTFVSFIPYEVGLQIFMKKEKIN